MTGMLATAMIVSSPFTTLSRDFSFGDMNITLELRRQLIENELVSSHLINIQTKDGVVTLVGTVDHLLAKQQARRIAENLKGVKEVRDQLTVEPVIRTDRVIRNDVISALAVDPVADSYEINVSVDDGIVTLEGEAESITEANIAILVAKGVKGVIAVVNDIDIKFHLSRSDKEIKEEIERSLELNPIVNGNEIDVEVSKGTVVLSGMVSSLAEKRKATLEAWTTGVKEVENSGLTVDWIAMDKLIDSELFVFKTDQQISRDVNDALLLEPKVDSTNIKVLVKNAVVTLTGKVNHYGAKLTALDTAGSILGVRRVKNYLLVRNTKKATK